MQNPQEVQLAVEALRAALPDSAFGAEAPLGLILGTGLSGLAAALAGDAGGAGPCVASSRNCPVFRCPAWIRITGLLFWAAWAGGRYWPSRAAAICMRAEARPRSAWACGSWPGWA